MVARLIERIDKWLSTNRADYYAKLQAGATQQELDAFEAKFRLRLPPDFRQLYQWRNGPSGSASLQDNRTFSSLDEIASTKEVLDASSLLTPLPPLQFLAFSQTSTIGCTAPNRSSFFGIAADPRIARRR
jgi:hypothetical protein